MGSDKWGRVRGQRAWGSNRLPFITEIDLSNCNPDRVIFSSTRAALYLLLASRSTGELFPEEFPAALGGGGE